MLELTQLPLQELDLLTVVKRGSDTQTGPVWVFYILFGITGLVFLPVLVFLFYTLLSLFPLLGIICEENLKSYDAVALNDIDADDEDLDRPLPLSTSNDDSHHVHTPLRTTVLGLSRFLYSRYGWRGFFRGLPIHALSSFFSGFVLWMVASVAPPVVASLVATVLLMLFRLVWNHQVLVKRPGWSIDRLFERLSAPLEVIRVTGLAFVLGAISKGIAQYTVYAIFQGAWQVSIAITPFLMVRSVESRNDNLPDDYFSSVMSLAMFICLSLLAFACQLPTQTVLFRVQASMLPEDTETIITYNRTFGILGHAQERGYITVLEAVRSLDWSFWKRLLLLYIQICATFMLVFALMGTVTALEVALAFLVVS